MSGTATPPAVETYVATLEVDSNGVHVALGTQTSQRLAIPSAGRLVCAWSVSSRPSDVNGAIYVATNVNGPVSATDMAARLTAGTAIRLDPGEVLRTPDAVPGPFALDLSVTAVGAATTIRIVLHLVAKG